MPLRPASLKLGGFTLMELMTVVVIIIVLVSLVVPISSRFRERADEVQCISNLRNLHVATQSYVQDNGYWPQIGYQKDKEAQYAREWLSALHPYGINIHNLICPGAQKALKNPPVDENSNARSDYLATPFDNQRLTPYKWSTQPWFIERGDVHGAGNLMIFPDGHTCSTSQLGVTL